MDEGLDGRRAVPADAAEASEMGTEFGKFEGLWEGWQELRE